MRKMLVYTVAVSLVSLTALPALAFKAAPAPSVGARAALADAIVIGSITNFEEKPVKALPYRGATEKVDITIAVVKVEQNLFGAKGFTHIKVGTIPGGRRSVTLAKGEEVALLLTKHPQENFYLLQEYYNKLDPKAENFKAEVEEIKKTVAVFDKPLEALKAKDADERYRAAAVLLQRYRPRDRELTKTKPIDAEESKLILQALADVNWNNFRGDWVLSPQGVFGQLQLTDKDGWVAPKPGQKYDEVARQWLKENAEKYRIQRVVKDDEK